MSNPLVGALVQVLDDCPMKCMFHDDDYNRVLITMGRPTDALDVPLDMVFERGALQRFVDLASEMLAAAELAARR